MKRSIISLVVVFMIALSGCGGGSSSNTDQLAGESELSKLDRDTLTLFEQKTQALLSSEIKTSDQALAAFSEFISAMKVAKKIGKTSGSEAHFLAIISKTLNTPEKLEAEQRFEALLPNTIFLLPSEDSKGSLKSCEIIHVNGIATPKIKAASDALALQNALSSNFNGQEISIALIFSPTHGIVLDFGEVVRQKILEYPKVSIELIVKAFFWGAKINDISFPEALQNAAIEYSKKKEKEARNACYDDADFSEIMAGVRNIMINNERNLIFEGHSQGSIYITEIYDRLTFENPGLKDRIRIVFAGPAAADIVGDGLWITSTNDKIIEFLSSFFSVLAPNTTINFTSDDPLGHGFEEVYLPNGLIDLIHEAILSFPAPSDETHGGGWGEVTPD